jgi:HSP20 family protein
MASGSGSPFGRGSASPGRGGVGGGSLFDLNRQINRLFEELFEQRPDRGLAGAATVAPPMDVHHTEQNIEITAELPGVKEEDIDITVEDGVLVLSGEKKKVQSDEERGYVERSYGRFERRITLPPNVDENACSANFENGVLTINLPISEDKARGRKIPLRTAKSGSSTSEPSGTAKEQPAGSGQKRSQP